MKKSEKNSPRDSSHAGRRRARPNVSLARALSKLGVTSRSQAREMILSGRVAVNGKVLTNPDVRVHPEREAIVVDGKTVKRRQRLYIMMNKPGGYVTTRSDERGRRTVYDLLKDPDRWLFPVGRLDQDSRGLLLFTNDAQWANALMDPDSKSPKVYQVRLDREMDMRDMKQFESGLVLDDGFQTRPAEIKRLQRTEGGWVEVTITEGRNRQIRRMMTALGYDVQDLVRTRIGPVSLKGVPEGGTRPMTPGEIRALTLKSAGKH